MTYGVGGLVPVTQKILDDAEADARAIYGVPIDWDGTAHEWLQMRTRATLDRIEAMYERAAEEGIT